MGESESFFPNIAKKMKEIRLNGRFYEKKFKKHDDGHRGDGDEIAVSEKL